MLKLSRFAKISRNAFLVLIAAVIGFLARKVVIQRWLTWRFLKKNPKYKEWMEQFGLMGVMPRYAKNYHRFYDERKDVLNESGMTSVPVSPSFLGSFLFVMTSDPRNVEYILKTNFNNFVKGELLNNMLGNPLLGKGIFAVDHGPHSSDQGKTWTRQRKTSSKIFTRNVFQGTMYQTFSENSKIVIDKLERTRGEIPIDLEAIMFQFTMDSIGFIGFGVNLGTLQSSKPTEFMKAFDESQKLVGKRFLLPFYSTLGRLYKAERQLYQHVDTLDSFSYKVIDERIADENCASKSDILSHFVNDLRSSGELDGVVNKKKYHEIRTFLRDVVMSFFIAGRDTTAASLSFTFLMLCNHPNVQDKLRAEIQEELGHPKEMVPPTLAQLKSGFKYLDAVINEVLRLYPPVPTDPKVACCNCILPDGTYIHEGTRIAFEPYIMGRSERIWGKDADKFDPERWIGPNAVQPTPFEMPTFQPGPRQCLGKDLALFETKVLTVELVRRFSFSLAREQKEPHYIPGVTITVNGKLPVIAKPIK